MIKNEDDWEFTVDDFNLKAIFESLDETVAPDNKELASNQSTLIEAYWDLATKVTALHKLLIKMDRVIVKVTGLKDVLETLDKDVLQKTDEEVKEYFV